MNLRCSFCQTPFTIGRNQMLAALQMMQNQGLQHYDAHCPRCRRANQISRERMEHFFPNWQEALAAITGSAPPKDTPAKPEPVAKAKAATQTAKKPVAAKAKSAPAKPAKKPTAPKASPATKAKPAAPKATSAKPAKAPAAKSSAEKSKPAAKKPAPAAAKKTSTSKK